MQHINHGSRSEEERTKDETRLDIALQSFIGALIPGPYVFHASILSEYAMLLFCLIVSQDGRIAFWGREGGREHYRAN